MSKYAFPIRLGKNFGDFPLSVFEALISPLTADEFFSEYYAKKHVIFEPGEAFTKRFLTWDLLTDALNRAGFDNARNIVLTKNSADSADSFGHHVNNRQYNYLNRDTGYLNISEIYKGVREGATLVFNSIYKYTGKYLDLEGEIERLFLCRPSFNAYASMNPEPGLGMHWDDHDVIAIQCEGRKFWQLYGFTTEYPLSRDASSLSIPKDAKPVWEGYLEAGQCMYVPRGMWHMVLSTGRPSLHITCGIKGVVIADILNHLARSPEANALLRRNIQPDYMSLEDIEETEAQIRTSVEALLRPGFLQEFWNDRKRNAPPVSGQAALVFDWAALTEKSHAAFTFRGPLRPVLTPSGGGFSVALDDREFEVPASFKSVFENLSDIGDSSLTELAQIAESDGVSFDELLAFLQLLNKHGVVEGSA